MDRASLIQEAGVLIAKEHARGLVHGHVCYWKEKLSVENFDHTTRQHLIFFQLNTSHLVNGLSTKEWDQLEANLWNFFKEKI